MTIFIMIGLHVLFWICGFVTGACIQRSRTLAVLKIHIKRMNYKTGVTELFRDVLDSCRGWWFKRRK